MRNRLPEFPSVKKMLSNLSSARPHGDWMLTTVAGPSEEQQADKPEPATNATSPLCGLYARMRFVPLSPKKTRPLSIERASEMGVFAVANHASPPSPE